MEPNVVWRPQPRQAAFLSRAEDEVLYGGAAGGGKSDALVADAMREIHIPHYKGIIFRENYTQLVEIIDKTQKLYPAVNGKAWYHDTKHTWFFPSGAKIILGSIPHDKDRFKHQGIAYDFIGFDELTHFSQKVYDYLRSRNRANGPGTRPRIRATANPGGKGHGWVKERFITAAPPEKTVWERVSVRLPDGSTQKKWSSRTFIPSSVFDNPALLENDPNYLTRLASLPTAEREALLYGNWDSFSGQYFSEWKNDPTHYRDRRWTHVIEPFDIPAHWKIYRSYDFGSARPFSCGWWAVDTEGTFYRIAEFYGCTGTPNEGLKWAPERQFARIAEIEREHPYLMGKRILGVADPSIWNRDRGVSVAENAEKYGIYFQPGDNSRITGWMQVHNRLQFDDDGRPRMYFFNTCKNAIRTLPALVHSESMVEDLDSDGEDHIADEVRYMCMLHPVKAITPKNKQIYTGDDPLELLGHKKYY